MPLKLTRRTGSPHWQITGSLRGVRVRESTGTSRREHAEALRSQRETEILDRDVYGERATATFAEAVNLYLDLGGDRRYLAPLVLRWGTRQLAAITPLEIGRAGREIYAGAAASTLNRQLYTPLIAVLNTAAEAGLCPAPKLRRPKVKRVLVEAATDAWIWTVLDAQPKQGPWRPGSRSETRFLAARARLRALVLLMTTTGARVSEAVALRRRDVDFERARALLRTTKNGEPREIGLEPLVIEALRALPDHGPDAAILGYASRYTARQSLERAADAAGVARHSAHQAGRHAFAARMLADGATLATLQEAGGWADIGIVARSYGHLERSAVREAVRAAGTKLTQARGGMAANVVKFQKKT